MGHSGREVFPWQISSLLIQTNLFAVPSADNSRADPALPESPETASRREGAHRTTTLSECSYFLCRPAQIGDHPETTRSTTARGTEHRARPGAGREREVPARNRSTSVNATYRIRCAPLARLDQPEFSDSTPSCDLIAVTVVLPHHSRAFCTSLLRDEYGCAGERLEGK